MIAATDPGARVMDGSSSGRDGAPDLDLVGHRVGHYAVESTLGRGGMGEVYLAQDVRLPRQVALKRVASVDVGQQAGGIAFWRMTTAR
jgi:serine/threonine protein kinase